MTNHSIWWPERSIAFVICVNHRRLPIRHRLHGCSHSTTLLCWIGNSNNTSQMQIEIIKWYSSAYVASPPTTTSCYATLEVFLNEYCHNCNAAQSHINTVYFDCGTCIDMKFMTVNLLKQASQMQKNESAIPKKTMFNFAWHGHFPGFPCSYLRQISFVSFVSCFNPLIKCQIFHRKQLQCHN